jgi:isoquinoline 1-oxidoreductase alpha subunit
VHIEGAPIRSCVLPVSAVQPTQRIVTIEGLSPESAGGAAGAAGSHALQALQKAWIQLDVPQCGYCQTGMIMAAAALLKSNPKPTDADIDAAVTNICRCGTYNRVRAAIKLASGQPAQAAGADIVHVVRSE